MYRTCICLLYIYLYVILADIYTYEIDDKLVVIDIGNASVRYFAPSNFHKELKDFEQSVHNGGTQQDQF